MIIDIGLFFIFCVEMTEPLSAHLGHRREGQYWIRRAQYARDDMKNFTASFC